MINKILHYLDIVAFYTYTFTVQSFLSFGLSLGFVNLAALLFYGCCNFYGFHLKFFNHKKENCEFYYLNDNDNIIYNCNIAKWKKTAIKDWKIIIDEIKGIGSNKIRNNISDTSNVSKIKIIILFFIVAILNLLTSSIIMSAINNSPTQRYYARYENNSQTGPDIVSWDFGVLNYLNNTPIKSDVFAIISNFKDVSLSIGTTDKGKRIPILCEILNYNETHILKIKMNNVCVDQVIWCSKTFILNYTYEVQIKYKTTNFIRIGESSLKTEYEIADNVVDTQFQMPIFNEIRNNLKDNFYEIHNNITNMFIISICLIFGTPLTILVFLKISTILYNKKILYDTIETFKSNPQSEITLLYYLPQMQPNINITHWSHINDNIMIKIEDNTIKTNFCYKNEGNSEMKMLN